MTHTAHAAQFGTLAAESMLQGFEATAVGYARMAAHYANLYLTNSAANAAAAPMERQPAPVTTKMLKTLAARRPHADAVHVLTLAEASADPSILGRLVRAALLHQGFYCCTVAGEKRLYIRQDLAHAS